MSKNNTLSAFFVSDVLTVGERNDLVTSLLNLRENVFNTAQKEIYKKDIVGLPAVYVSPLVQAGSAASNKTAAQVLDTLIAELQDLPAADLTLSYKPTTAQTKELLQFLRAKLHAELIVQLLYEPQITAGFMLEYEGTRTDYTLQTVLDNKAIKT